MRKPSTKNTALLAAAVSLLFATNAQAVEGVAPVPASVPGRLLVKFKSEADADAAHGQAGKLGVHAIRHLRAGGKPETAIAKRWRVMHFADDASLATMMDRLSRLPGVEWVEPDQVVSAAAIPNDSRFGELWGMHNIGQTGGIPDADLDAPEAWDTLKGGAVLVAVVDTGVDYNHADLAANVWSNPGEIAANGVDDDRNGYVDDTRGWNFVADNNNPYDDNSHGSHVSGTIAAVGDNGQGVVGVNRLARILPLKFLDAQGYGYTSDAVEAIYYAIDQGAKVMNHSWGGASYSQSLADAFTAALNANIVMAVAAGNASQDLDTVPSYPAALPHANIITVAATTHNDDLAYFSNYGALSVDLGAPGEAILSSVPGNGYASYSGTSMATPHVAGAASLLLAANANLSSSQVKDILLGAANPVAALAGKSVSGGRLNLQAALAAAVTQPAVNLPPVANAGPDLALARGARAVLNGTASFDPDGTIASYAWVSSNRTVVSIVAGATTATPTVAVSTRARSGTVVTLTLTVSDNKGVKASDEMRITVK
ncbi:MAG: S8 family serine peptidase [Polaromonas sp.]|uniref:S8 family peptidase n=1 Tax=Polaromonas sp. TaxID=1869339 RepID=UPI002732B8CD|nr:S8 family serine peptidase [Polaromonas sp.]MDP2820077.1 S8 family serine peptidase [Polaromonas sp.]